MKKINFSKIFNCLMATILVCLWGSIFFVHGVIGAIAWALVKMVIAPVGVILLFINLIFFIKSLVKKERRMSSLITVILSVLIALPMLMLMNVLKVEYPANINKIKPSITATWPLNEKSIVGWGGNTVEVNGPHVIWASERWAYDLVMEPYNINSDNLSDYGIYDKEVFSPVNGTIVAAYDDEDDIRPNTEEFLSMEGNHVYIKIDETNTYLLLNHLKKDSVDVKVGDKISEGDFVGKVGNSGSTSEPHLHIHHQRQDPTKTIHPIFAEGLPLYFKNIEGEVDNVMPERGEVITPKN
ncbi:M23 family metallopeptidase [Clostridium gasigenes]|uniref:M23 family metallopeptidase n=1 Tax=Clostridium gasigenes TaxID=94869 RepID=UPI001C0C43DB|nr:M23 family metallopeptidase [Clostridium gasigenes]